MKVIKFLNGKTEYMDEVIKQYEKNRLANDAHSSFGCAIIIIFAFIGIFLSIDSRLAKEGQVDVARVLNKEWTPPYEESNIDFDPATGITSLSTDTIPAKYILILRRWDGRIYSKSVSKSAWLNYRIGDSLDLISMQGRLTNFHYRTEIRKLEK